MCQWLCACGHHNPVWRMSCRRCREPRPLGSLYRLLRTRRLGRP